MEWLLTLDDLEVEHRRWEIPDVYFDADERRRRETAAEHVKPEDEDDGADE